MVIELLTVNADAVIFPLEPMDVNKPVLGVALPIGVFCMPPKALKLVIAVIDPLLVMAAAVTLPVALNVLTIAVLPPADPSVPFSGPLNELVAVYVAPVNVEPELPNVAAFIVVPVSVPVTPNVEPIVAELLTVNAEAVMFPLEPTDVNKPVLGVALPIGVFCMPPNALKLVLAVIDPLLVSPAPVILPVADKVVN
jgi:hypothetical protein